MSVLINGSSGTGKEYVAHRIHQLSKRNDKPFIAVDCGSIPKELAASEFSVMWKVRLQVLWQIKRVLSLQPTVVLSFWMRSETLVMKCRYNCFVPCKRENTSGRFYTGNIGRYSSGVCHQWESGTGYWERHFPWRPLSSYQWVYSADAWFERAERGHSTLCQFLPRSGKQGTG